jgi:glutamyl-tRNA(Gln) amidotransferase subunit E
VVYVFFGGKMKIGLEIHQRLATNKLFCDCPTKLMEEADPDHKIERRLHPVLSELGEIDPASKAEFLKGKTFLYHVYNETNCLVETDEEPPHEMNRDALAAVLQIAAQLKANPVDEIHTMRKIVIDGSNTSGFQRTAIVAMDGKLETSRGPIGIPLLAIEEESAGIITNTEAQAVYRLDRLGIPLIEITTTPDIQDGEHLLEVAQKIGMILRATGRVARGIGTIRQDVNISTERGARVEIKGAQDLKLLTLQVKYEVMRQEKLLEIVDELKKRFGKKWKLSTKPVDVSAVFANTQSQLISKGLKSGSRVFAILLEQHAGLLGIEIQPNRRYGSELSDYAKKAGVKGIIHSDEDLDKYKISKAELDTLHRTLNTKPQDAFAVVVAPEQQAKEALLHALNRANMDYIPEETRKPNPAGTTSFARPLPGRARMYPETDIPPIKVTTDMISTAAKAESLEDKQKKLEEILNPELAKKMLKSRNLSLFEKLVKQGADPMLVANTLENTLVSLRREGVVIENLEFVLPQLFAAYSYGKFVKAAIPAILKEIASGTQVAQAIKGFAPIPTSELKLIVQTFKGDIKQIMAKYRTRIDPKELQKLLKKK